MTEILVFHHAPGPTPCGFAFADDLCRAGHTVHTPDLLGGRTFNTVGEGVGNTQDIGFGEIMGRGVRAAGELPAPVVDAGFSMGEMPARRVGPDAGRDTWSAAFACLPSSVGV